MDFRIYDIERAYEREIQWLKEGKITYIRKGKTQRQVIDVLPENKTLILEFDRYLKVHEDVTTTRRLKYLRLMAKIAELLAMDFRKATKQDIMCLAEKIGDHPTWADATKRDHLVFVKRFYKWLLTEDEYYPEEVSWIKLKDKNHNSIEKSELLTQEDLEKVLSVACNSRDKAFIHVLFESGCRIGEIGTLRRKDVSFDKFGCLIHVTGKTGRRPIRLVKSTNDFSYWYNHAPNKDPEAPVWCRLPKLGEPNPQECLQYWYLAKLLRVHFKRAGLKKKCNPHLFRHGALTKLSQHLSDQELKIYAGWSKTSNMIQVYSHLTGNDVEDKILAINGIDTKKNEIDDKPLLCPRCDAPNNRAASFCFNCRHVLDEKLAQSLNGDAIIEQIKSSPEAMAILDKLVRVLNK